MLSGDHVALPITPMRCAMFLCFVHLVACVYNVASVSGLWIKQFENLQSNMVETKTNRYLLAKIHGRSLSWLGKAFSIKNWWAQTSFIRPNISSYWIDMVMQVIIFNSMHSIRIHRATDIVIWIILVMKFTIV